MKYKRLMINGLHIYLNKKFKRLVYNFDKEYTTILN